MLRVSAILFIVYIIISVAGGIAVPVISMLTNNAETTVFLSRALQYTLLIAAAAFALLAAGAFREKPVSAILAVVGALMVAAYLALGAVAWDVALGSVPVPMLLLSAMRALAFAGYAVAMALLLNGGGRVFGFVTAGLIALLAVVNAAMTAWAFASAEDPGYRLSAMGYVSTFTGWLQSAVMLVLASVFIYHTVVAARRRDGARRA